MHDQETGAPAKVPKYERIAGQGFVWLKAEKARIGDPKNDDKKRAELRERRRLAVVLDEERPR